MFGNLAALCSCASHYTSFISSCSLALWETQSHYDLARYPAYLYMQSIRELSVILLHAFGTTSSRDFISF